MKLAIKLEIFSNILSGIAEEMGVRLQHSAYSPNIKERRDFSCALFDNHGRLAAQAAHIPVHLGSMPVLIRRIRENFKLQPGDVIITNDPFFGGTHLPDITLVEPVFIDERLWGYAAARAHHSDIGGMAAGSMPDSTQIYQEGVIIPPLLLRSGGKTNLDLLKLIITNTRTPKERLGDLYAQEAALATARERIGWMTGLYGFDESLHLVDELMNYSERLTRMEIEKTPNGTAGAEDFMEDDRKGENVSIRAMVIIDDESVTVDFSGTAPQRNGSVNAPLPVTMAAVYYVFRCLFGDRIPANDGCFRPVKVNAPEGCLVNAQSPYAVSAGNVETSQRIVDVVLKALAQVIPDRIPAASCGTMNNLAIGAHRGKGKGNFAYYETVAGGMGGGPNMPGLSVVQTHMTNTMNTPVEALETAFPFTITRYEVRKNSGGKGMHNGGDGVVREYAFQIPCQVSIVSERRKNPPYGLNGGQPGMTGKNVRFYGKTGETEVLPGKTTFQVESGDHIIIETPGGGGWGRSDAGGP